MKKQKIITCTGYGGTGSSAITDLLKEFNNVYSYGDFEFDFIYYPNGIRDLEYGLLENNERNVTDYRIKKFKKNMDNLSRSHIKSYSKIFGNKFKILTNKYIESLINVKWKGYSSKDISEEILIKKLLYYSERFIQKKVLRLKEGGAKFYRNKNLMNYSYVSKKKFYDKTKLYLNELFLELIKDKSLEFLALDQLVPSSNINKYLDYFYDIKVIVVDRDPRDIYLLNELYWKEAWIPSNDISRFIKWFKLIREHQKYETEDKEKILRIKFEDLIYNYEETLNKILKFLNIEKTNHIKKMEFFNPGISVKNTRLWEKTNKYKDEINKISKELSQFCYKLKKGKHENKKN